MKRVLILAVMMFCLTLVSCKEAGQNEWDTLCPWLAGIELSCDNLDPPTVEFVEPSNPSLQGYYKGGNIIYISDSLSDKLTSATIVHEIIHYLQVMSSDLKLPGPARQICEAEDQAFRITDTYREYIGLDRVGDDWWRPYWYCWQYYAPEGSRMIVLRLPTGEILIDVME